MLKGWLSNYFHFYSDDNLTQPDFQEALSHTFNLSGTYLTIKHATHNAAYIVPRPQNHINILDVNSFEFKSEKYCSLNIYKRGWYLQGKKKRVVGSIMLSSYFGYFSDIKVNLSNLNTFEKLIIEYCHDLLGELTDAPELGKIAEGGYIYPIDNSKICYQTINSINWANFTVSEKGKAPRFIYIAPISQHHWILIEFLTEGGGYDFYSSASNLKQTCYDVVSNFMSHVHLKLSEESKAQQAQAKAPIGGGE